MQQRQNQILEIKNLRTSFFTPEGEVKAVDDVSLEVQHGKTLGIVGESGSGKSVLSLSIMRLVPQPPGRILSGQVIYRGQDLLKFSPREMRAMRGNEISMIFQEPMTSLNPVFTIGNQLCEAIALHQDLPRREIRNRAIEMLKAVGISTPEKRMEDYPHLLSGGMRQRAMIAMALACHPKILIADEPTTALDVTIQAQILDLLQSLQKQMGMTLILITHDWGVVAEMVDEVVVMREGKIVERGLVKDLFARPQAAYTIKLLNCVSSQQRSLYSPPENVFGLPKGLSGAPYSSGPVLDTHVLISVQGIEKRYPLEAGLFSRELGKVNAVAGVSFDIRKGETLALVGESGCGKSTLARCILRLIEPSAGQIFFNGENITHLDHKNLRRIRKNMQIIFQDPYASLNPRLTVESLLAEPLKIHGICRDKPSQKQKIYQLLDLCGLRRESISRYPHEFSGGQRQRICIARALAVEPSFIVCDEPVSALDISIQAQILKLMEDLQKELGLTYLFISHDLRVVQQISARVAVMYLGKIVELTSVENLYHRPQHPYTRSLLSAIPIPDPHLRKKRVVLSGDVPSALFPPSGCHFHPRCPIVEERCRVERTELKKIDFNASRHEVACHLAQ